MKSLAVAVLISLLVSGCVSSASDPPASEGAPLETDAAPPSVPMAEVSPEPRVTIDLGVLGVDPTVFSGVCPCPVLALQLDEAARNDGWLDVRVSWDGTQSIGFAAVVTDGFETWHSERGFDATRIKIPAAAAGNYELHVEGEGQFTVHAFVRASGIAKTSTEFRLPNIVTLVPEQVAFGRCDNVERDEQGAMRCLRLGNAIGNIGDGPLEVHLGWVDSALGLAGEAQPIVDGQFMQRLHAWNGAPTDRAVGSTDFHTAHGHWHYDGFALFELFEVDPTTGLRGAVAAAGHKSGFCFLDWGEMPENEATAHDGGRAAQDCLVPTATGWSMGISTGYFDFYWAGLTDQYVEASNVGDGYFELVSTADQDDWLVEVDEFDNQASVLLRIDGDAVKVLERRGWYNIPPGTNQL